MASTPTGTFRVSLCSVVGRFGECDPLCTPGRQSAGKHSVLGLLDATSRSTEIVAEWTQGGDQAHSRAPKSGGYRVRRQLLAAARRRWVRTRGGRGTARTCPKTGVAAPRVRNEVTVVGGLIDRRGLPESACSHSARPFLPSLRCRVTNALLAAHRGEQRTQFRFTRERPGAAPHRRSGRALFRRRPIVAHGHEDH